MNWLADLRQQILEKQRNEGAQRYAGLLDLQAMRDSARQGSVGAPGGLLSDTSNPYTGGQIGNALALSSLAPGIGDVTGPMADAYMFESDPSSRTIPNYLLAGLGALPAIPSLAYLMNRGGSTTRNVSPFSNQSGMVGYHGSPHEFDEFDMSKIGTGEGAQAYGHGLYFAENPRVAKSYQGETSYADMVRKWRDELPDDAEFDEALDMARAGAFGDKGRDVIEALANNDWLGFDYPAQAISATRSKHFKDYYDPSPELVNAVESQGAFYHVDIPDEAIDKMLDWDAPLSEQPESVKEYAKSVLGEGYDSAIKSKGFDGESLYRAKNDPATVSDELKKLGIPGIKYFDGGSRSAGGGTRNFVVFDDKLPKILKRE